MGITYIPGPEATLGPALAQIAQGIGDIIKPGSRQQKAFQQALAQRPELIQQLADMEGQSPGTLESFEGILGPELVSVLSRMVPSLRSQRETAIAREIPGIANVPQDQLSQVAQTPAQIGAVASLTGARPQQLVEEAQQGKERVYAAEFISHMSDEDKKRMGVYGTSEGILQDPQFVKQLILGRELTRARRVDDINNFMLQKKITDATRWLDKTGVGTIDDWLLFFSDAGRARIKKIQQGGEPTEDDMRLLQAAEAFAQAPNELKYSHLNSVTDNIRQLIPSIDKSDQATRPVLVAALNQNLRSLGSGITAKWGQPQGVFGIGRSLPDWMIGDQLQFVDENNKPLSQNDALALLSTGQSRATRQPSPPGGNSEDVEKTRARARSLAQELFPGVDVGALSSAQKQQIRAKLKQEGYKVQ